MSCCGEGGFGGTGGASPGGVAVQDEGVPIGPGLSRTLNFVGAGVTVTDAGSNVAQVDIPGPPPNTTTYILPEQWAENNIRRNYENHVVDCQLSTHFDTFKMLTSGSITALSTRLTQAVTVGTATVEVTKNGIVQALSLTHTSVLNSSGGIANVPVGTVTYVAGDLIGIQLTTDGTFTPTSSDLEAMLEVTE